MAFASAIDIINRALQHVGATRISSLTENSKNASEGRFIYDSVRRAELRRNNWAFATKRAVMRPVGDDTMLVTPSAWDATVAYPRGSLVSYGGIYWSCVVVNSLNNTPGATSGYWQAYYGPITASKYDSETSYWAGELVYTVETDGRLFLYVSSINANEANTPGDIADWDTDTVYAQGEVVSQSSVDYYNLVPYNVGNDPSSSPTLWSSVTTYASGAVVGGSDGLLYTSAQSGNTNHQPTTDNGTWWTTAGLPLLWTTDFTNYVGKWTRITATLTNLELPFPVAAGSTAVNNVRQAFRLPYGFLRPAPQSPKQGAWSYLGAPSDRIYEDWLYEGNYLISSFSVPFIYRFIADVQYVPDMDDMFCEGLAARCALDLCEPLTQSSGKKRDIGAVYTQYMGEARLVNAIEAGEVEPPLDDYIQCRA